MNSDLRLQINSAVNCDSSLNFNFNFALFNFISKLFKLKEDSIDTIIIVSMTKLDNLARNVDLLLDANNIEENVSSINDFAGLKNSIHKSLEDILAQKNTDNLLNKVLLYTQQSFKYNTSERHRVYNLIDSPTNNQSTIIYLFPIVDYYISSKGLEIDINKVFNLYGNLVQLLDDYVDLFFDLEYSIRTPITECAIAKRGKNYSNSYDFNDFTSLNIFIYNSAFRYFEAIRYECFNLNIQIVIEEFQTISNFFTKWETSLYLKCHTLEEAKKYLSKLQLVIPPILNYST